MTALLTFTILVLGLFQACGMVWLLNNKPKVFRFIQCITLVLVLRVILF